MRAVIALALCAVLAGCDGVQASCCKKPAIYLGWTLICLGDHKRCELLETEYLLRSARAEQAALQRGSTEYPCTTALAAMVAEPGKDVPRPAPPQPPPSYEECRAEAIETDKIVIPMLEKRVEMLRADLADD